MKRIGALHLVLVLVGFSLLAIAVLYPLSTRPASLLYDARSFEGSFLNQPDVTLHAWILAWDTHKLVDGGWPTWFDANIFHPARGTLGHSDHMIGVLPFFAPLFLLSHQLALSFNFWIATTFALSGASTYLVAFLWTRSRAAALLSGVAFSLAPWRLNELSHPQLLSVQFLPAIAYLCLSEASPVRWHRAALLAVLLALQGTSSAYLGYLGFLVAGLCLAGRLVASGASRAGISRLIAALLLGAFPVVLLSLPYLSLETSGAIADKIEARGAGWGILATYLFPPAQDHGWLVWWLVPAFAVVGAAMGLRRAEHRARTAGLLACAVVSSLFAVSQARVVWGLPVGGLDDAASWLIPGWGALRVMPRFGIASWLAASLLCAIPFSRGSDAFPVGSTWLGARMGAAIAVCVAALLAGSSISFEIRTRGAPEAVRDPAPYAWLANHGEGAPLLEWPVRFGLSHSEAQYMSHRHWLPMVNGYSGYTAPWSELMRSLAQIYEPDALRTFISLGWARWLLVHHRPGTPQPPIWQPLTSNGATLVLEGEDSLLFELPYAGDSSIERLLHPSETHSLLGTRLEVLDLLDLQGSVQGGTRHLHGQLGLGLHLPFDVENRSRRTWPGVAVARDLLVGVEVRARRIGSSSRGRSVGFFRLPTDLGPGSATRVWTHPTGVLAAGTWELVPCLVQWDADAERCHEGAKVLLTVPAPPLP